MPAHSRFPAMTVFLNGRPMGELTKQGTGALRFQYVPSWLAWTKAVPLSLSLPLRETPYSGEPVEAVLDNALPDEMAIRRIIAERVHAAGTDVFSLLAAVGQDCVGALQFLPGDEKPRRTGFVRGVPISGKKIALLLNNLAGNPLGLSDDGEFRLSIAGAQEKTALLHWKNKWWIPVNPTPTTHIIKPPIGPLKNGMDLSDSVENEHFCMCLTAALGLPTAKTAIKHFEKTKALVVERYDRQWTSKGQLFRVPQEDGCQALSVPGHRKYQAHGGPGIKDILDLLQASDEPEQDRETFIKAQIVFWLLGATDGHAKNFSFFLLPGDRFRMAPLYDVMSAQPYVDRRQLAKNKMKMAMSIGRKRHYRFDTIMPRHFVETAEESRLPAGSVREMMDDLKKTIEPAIHNTMKSMPKNFPKDLMNSIKDGIFSRAQLL